MLLSAIILACCSYLAGSVPFGLLIGRVVKGVDIRDHGSGTIGATNAGRVLGRTWGLVCLLLDALKGWLPTMFLPGLLFVSTESFVPHMRVLAGVSTIVGHMFPCWLGFQGGKGVATSLGVVALLSPWGLLVAAGVFLSTFVVWRIVSLSSMIAAATFWIFQWATLRPSPFANGTWSQGLFAVVVPLLIVSQHRDNLRRLRKGDELAFGTVKKNPCQGTIDRQTEADSLELRAEA